MKHSGSKILTYWGGGVGLVWGIRIAVLLKTACNRVVQKYTKYMISINNKLLHVKLIIKTHVMGFFDPL